MVWEGDLQAARWLDFGAVVDSVDAELADQLVELFSIDEDIRHDADCVPEFSRVLECVRVVVPDTVESVAFGQHRIRVFLEMIVKVGQKLVELFRALFDWALHSSVEEECAAREQPFLVHFNLAEKAHPPEAKQETHENKSGNC